MRYLLYVLKYITLNIANISANTASQLGYFQKESPDRLKKHSM